MLQHILSRNKQFKDKMQRSGLSSEHQRLYRNSMLYTHYVANMLSVLSSDYQWLHTSTSLENQCSSSMN